MFKPFDPKEVLRAKVGVFIDLFRKTDKIKHQAQALRESEERFRLLVEGVKDYSIYMLDPQGCVATWSPAAQRMKGYLPSEIIGQSFSRFYPLEDVARDKPHKVLAKAMQEGRFEEEGWRVRKDGSRFWASVILTALYDPKGDLRGFCKVTRDVTEKKKTQEELHRKELELHQTRKIEAVGRLAGGVAHDFNNLITGILGISEEMKSQLDEQDPRHEDLEEIIKASHRAFSLTRQLLAFGRRQMVFPRVLDLNTVISELNKMLMRLLGEDIQLTTVLAPDLGRIKADPSQVEQVIMNLLLNSRDAMPKGGRITISTENIHLDQTSERSDAHVSPGTYVTFSVSDTGCGMDAETISHIYEPFFTTKEKDKGTGLGLSTVYGIVKQNGGEIFVDSCPGEGSTFTLFFPQVTEEVELTKEHQELPRAAAGQETVLVVEDEEIVRHVVKNVLVKKGYRVLIAREGLEAMELARQHPGSIDMLVTDVVMPGMNGRQVAESVLTQHPKAVVLYMSGYTEDIINHRGILEPGLAFIEKSAINYSLARKVRELLDARPPAPRVASGLT